jgi:hypothetical protein
LTKPKLVLNKVINHLKKNNGNLFLMFNNKYSLHRLLGCQMGFLKNIDFLTSAEKKHGHNFIFGEKFFDNYFDKRKLNYKKYYLGIKPLPTSKMKNFVKTKDFKKIMYPKTYKEYSVYIFYKVKLKKNN